MKDSPNTTDRARLLEAMARAICCPDGCKVIGCRGRLYEREAAAALAATDIATQASAAYQRGAVAMREAMASWLMCGCDTDEQARVVAAATTEGPNSGARWRACHRSDCMALLAAEALDLPIPEDKA